MRLTALIAAALPLAAHAQTAPDEPNAQGDVSVTIYNNDLALVQDKRTLNLAQGHNRQEFADVSARIRPETVTLAADDAGIVEQNFDYDLLSPQKLMDKAVGQSVGLVRTNPATGVETRETAQVLANNGGTIVRVGDRIEVLSGLGARVVFSKLPPNLRARPTLSVTLDASRGGPRPATLSYLSNGFGWKADYVTLFDEAAGKIDVQGWITLNNNSGTSFPNARTLLVAGAPGQVVSNQRFQPRGPSGNRPGTESANRERLGDYYVYPIEGRTTLANAQQKQVSFLDVHGTPAAKAYYFRNDWQGTRNEAVSVDTVLRFSASREGGLGDALPAGTVRVYMRDARGQPQFIGENNIPHTSMGSDLALKTGEAFDVKIQPTVEKRDRIDTGEWRRTARYRITRNGQTTEEVYDAAVTYWRTSMKYRLTNARPTPVTVEVVQGGLDHWWWHDTRVSGESIQGTQRSPDERVWLVTVPANGKTNLTVDFDTRY